MPCCATCGMLCFAMLLRRNLSDLPVTCQVCKLHSRPNRFMHRSCLLPRVAVDLQLPALRAEADPRAQQREWLLSAVAELWAGFQRRFCELWRQHGAKGDACSASLFDAAASKEVRRPTVVSYLAAAPCTAEGKGYPTQAAAALLPHVVVRVCPKECALCVTAGQRGTAAC